MAHPVCLKVGGWWWRCLWDGSVSAASRFQHTYYKPVRVFHARFRFSAEQMMILFINLLNDLLMKENLIIWLHCAVEYSFHSMIAKLAHIWIRSPTQILNSISNWLHTELQFATLSTDVLNAKPPHFHSIHRISLLCNLSFLNEIILVFCRWPP